VVVEEPTDGFDVMEVALAAADEVIAALRRATIEGRRPVVRRDRSDG
jgi:ATP-dependent RNA helicase DeaD